MDRTAGTDRGRTAAVVVACVLLSSAGCSTTSREGTRAGGSPPPLVLTMGTNDPQGRPSADQVEEFARQVDELSDGTIRVEPQWRAGGEGVTDWDQRVARMVVGGDLDLAMVPARAWDTEGVTSLRALSAPFVVDSDETMNAVVEDERLATDLMLGLEAVGVSGLALVPEGIRRLMTLGGGSHVIQGLVDGGAVRSPRSETTWAFFEELGATPTDDDSAARLAAESQVSLAGTVAGASGVVGNLALFAKVNTLVIGTELLESLDADQQQVLRDAAAGTRDWAVATNPTEPELAAAYCEGGGTVVHDDDSDSAPVRRAAEAVIDELRADDVTDGLLDRVEEHAQWVAPVLQPCSAGVGVVTAEEIVADGGDLPDGLYRFELTEDWLSERGLTGEQIEANAGLWTFELGDGSWSLEQVASGAVYTEAGIYQVRDDELFWRFGGDDFVFHLRWSVDEAGDLRFEDASGMERYGDFHFLVPWRRIGDAERTVTADSIEPDGGGLPDGTYRFELTDRYLAEHGLTPESVAFNHGVWTIEMEDGHWSLDQVAPDIVDHAEGIYEVRDDQLWFLPHDESDVIHATWRVGDDGSLHFVEVGGDPESPDFQFDLPWRRVG